MNCGVIDCLISLNGMTGWMNDYLLYLLNGITGGMNDLL